MPLGGVRRVSLKAGADLDGFRRAARALVAGGVAPDAAIFEEGESLFPDEPPADAAPLALPAVVHRIVEEAGAHADPVRYALLYRLIWRVLHGERALPAIASDPLVHRLDGMRRAVRRDLHKMTAFVRFRERPDGRFVAWFEPEHHILEAAAPFFVGRFGSLDWSILTPRGSIHWLGGELAFGPPASRADAPASDAFEDAWRGYYRATFNPARVNPKLMRAEMPERYWRNLPEAREIPDLLRASRARADMMVEAGPTTPRKREPAAALRLMGAPREPTTLDELNALLRAAEPLFDGVTGAVCGEGPAGAAIMFVGEQPGDEEDRRLRPFVGPAGRLFDRALGEAGVAREASYLTNAVKHFKHEPRGKRRIHATPNAGEIAHYRWWLTKEVELVRPRLVVALGASAVRALTGRAASVVRERGPARFGGRDGFVTVHPASILRQPDERARAAAYAAFVSDLAQARALADA